MGFGDILDEAFDLYKSNFVLLVGIAAVFYVPFEFASNTLLLPYLNAFGSPEAAGNVNWTAFGTALIACGAIFVAGYAAVTGALTYAIAQRYLGEPASIGGSFSYIWRRGLSYIGTLLLYMLALGGPSFFVTLLGGISVALESVVVMILFVVLLLGAIVFTVMACFRLPFVTTCFVVEGTGPVGSLKRSWRIANGHVGRIFGVMFVTTLVVEIVSGIASSPAAFLIPMGIYSLFVLGMRDALLMFILPFIYMLAIYVFFAIVAWIYNLIGATFGGVEFTTNEVEKKIDE